MRRAEIISEPIEMAVTGGTPVTVVHGLGRPVSGWLVIYQTADISFWLTSQGSNVGDSITLTPTGTGTVRLVLLQ